MNKTDERMIFDYYYGQEAEQFAFYRVPRLLIKDDRFKELSNDAKLLYGLMLDRMSLSMKNGWIDDRNRAYIIYTLEQVATDLNCSEDKATRVIAELDMKKGIGLIEKIRRGLGKPDIIYVKNFVSRVNNERLQEKEADNDTDMENADAADNGIKKPQNAESRNRKMRNQETVKCGVKKPQNAESRNRKMRNQEIAKCRIKKPQNEDSGNCRLRIQDSAKKGTNYTDISHTDDSQTNVRSINLVSQILKTKGTDEMDISASLDVIRKNIEYDYAMSYLGVGQRELFDELYQLICEVVCVKRESIKIGGVEIPHEIVRERFLKLTRDHLYYVMHRMKETTTKISNIKAYLITALYNAPSTIDYYYEQEVRHDMYGTEY